MNFIYLYVIFLLELIVNLTNGIDENPSYSRPTQWSCHLGSQHRLECRNLFNFYFSSHSLCADDNRLLVSQHIDEIYIYNDYNCFDHSYSCYLEIDPTWTMCLNSLKKLTIENVSFIVRNDEKKALLPLDYLKMVNTHGSVTELLQLFTFSNRSSIYIQNPYPRWSGMDLLAIYSRFTSIRFKQLWINVLDWYPIVYWRRDQQLGIQQWLLNIPCLHIELGDCRSYYHDMVFLRDFFDSRRDTSNELFCYPNRGTESLHWSKVPELNYYYTRSKPPTANSLMPSELQENCFDQFTKKIYTINSYTDLDELFSNFQKYDSYPIPISNEQSYVSLPTTRRTTTMLRVTPAKNRSSYRSKIDYINIHKLSSTLNETRWLSCVAAYPDGRFLLMDNRNQKVLLLNENGSYRIDLTPIFLRQIQAIIYDKSSISSDRNSYSYSRIYVDGDGYIYLIQTLAYYIYVFSSDNRLIRCLTPQLLGLTVIRPDCLSITHTGLIYACDDIYRVIRVYSRMGIPQRSIRLDFLPLQLLISNNKLFTYSTENLAHIQMYTLAGVPIRTLGMCSYKQPSEIVWFRGKYFLTCGIYLFVLDEQGDQIAERSLHTLLDYSDISTVNDFALNKNGLMLATFRRNGTLFNRYWIIRPTTF